MYSYLLSLPPLSYLVYTIPFSSGRALIPIPHTSSMCFALVGWSFHIGIASIGTPRLSASRTELKLQRVGTQLTHDTALPVEGTMPPSNPSPRPRQ
ncbi:hypothetical protein V6N11_023961 [Hibiscus sabdariffa]|uniref:Uncharacterized protein n=1 Tax=Hibiscus sabdariffa TaxID=183260 RepID=A0ABR2TPA3_9ROSI